MTGIKRIGLFLVTNLLVVIVISIITSFIGLDSQSYMGLLILCTMFGLTGSFISLWMSKFIAKKAYRIQLIDPNKASGKELFLFNAIENMAQNMNVITPEIGVYQAQEANAFATGPSQDNSLVAFSSGIINNLNEDELAAVLAHEMSHIKNGDMVTMTLLVGIVNTFVMFFARILAIMLSSKLGNRKRGGMGFIGNWILIVLFENILMLLAYIPICSYSRWREYRADRGSAELTQPSHMINALEKIDRLYYPDQKKDSFALAKINNRHRASLYSTHPPISDRIKRLSEITY